MLAVVLGATNHCCGQAGRGLKSVSFLLEWFASRTALGLTEEELHICLCIYLFLNSSKIIWADLFACSFCVPWCSGCLNPIYHPAPGTSRHISRNVLCANAGYNCMQLEPKHSSLASSHLQGRTFPTLTRLNVCISSIPTAPSAQGGIGPPIPSAVTPPLPQDGGKLWDSGAGGGGSVGTLLSGFDLSAQEEQEADEAALLKVKEIKARRQRQSMSHAATSSTGSTVCAYVSEKAGRRRCNRQKDTAHPGLAHTYVLTLLLRLFPHDHSFRREVFLFKGHVFPRTTFLSTSITDGLSCWCILSSPLPNPQCTTTNHFHPPNRACVGCRVELGWESRTGTFLHSTLPHPPETTQHYQH
jgi:hypothetical protein